MQALDPTSCRPEVLKKKHNMPPTRKFLDIWATMETYRHQNLTMHVKISVVFKHSQFLHLDPVCEEKHTYENSVVYVFRFSFFRWFMGL